jgi:hypothetical protein
MRPTAIRKMLAPILMPSGTRSTRPLTPAEQQTRGASGSCAAPLRPPGGRRPRRDLSTTACWARRRRIGHPVHHHRRPPRTGTPEAVARRLEAMSSADASKSRDRSHEFRLDPEYAARPRPTQTPARQHCPDGGVPGPLLRTGPLAGRTENGHAHPQLPSRSRHAVDHVRAAGGRGGARRPERDSDLGRGRVGQGCGAAPGRVLAGGPGCGWLGPDGRAEPCRDGLCRPRRNAPADRGHRVGHSSGCITVRRRVQRLTSPAAAPDRPAR